MATALIGGLLESSTAIGRLHVIEPELSARDGLLKKFHQTAQHRKIELTLDSQDCPKSFIDDATKTWVVLAVKPQQMQQACVSAPESLKQLLSKARLLSVAAGVSTEALSFGFTRSAYWFRFTLENRTHQTETRLLEIANYALSHIDFYTPDTTTASGYQVTRTGAAESFASRALQHRFFVF
ncbi:MAG: hypothetical protein EBU74_10100, partial [Betaproteobacteria bacterium]|nr:hypothetical protein [Betaproteobacteria bacterium]